MPTRSPATARGARGVGAANVRASWFGGFSCCHGTAAYSAAPRANTERKIKITLPGPFTMSRQAKNEFYKDEEELVMDYAAAVNAEIRDLKAAGADVIQLDEP